MEAKFSMKQNTYVLVAVIGLGAAAKNVYAFDFNGTEVLEFGRVMPGHLIEHVLNRKTHVQVYHVDILLRFGSLETNEIIIVTIDRSIIADFYISTFPKTTFTCRYPMCSCQSVRTLAKSSLMFSIFGKTVDTPDMGSTAMSPFSLKLSRLS